jgi:hypothetical protein
MADKIKISDLAKDIEFSRERFCDQKMKRNLQKTELRKIIIFLLMQISQLPLL